MGSIIFSVVMPVYNREEFVSCAVESLLKQTCQNWELILIDDGSTDKTGMICSDYAKKDQRIRYQYQKNEGVCVARNQGLKQAAGNYIVFLDSDDALASNALEILQRWVLKYPEVDFICFGYQSGSKVWIPAPQGHCDIISRREILEKYLPTHINIRPQDQYFLKNFIWNKCYRNDFLRKHKLYFDEGRRTWEDGLYVVNCLAEAEEIAVLGEFIHRDLPHIITEHLSAKVYPDQLLNYVKDETYFYHRFYGKYDFSSQHYCRANFNVLNMLFEQVIETFGGQAESQISQAIPYEIVKQWAEHLGCKSRFEQIVCMYLVTENSEALYKLYSLRLFCRKIKRRILHE